MCNTPNQNPSHEPDSHPVHPIVATAFRGPVLREYSRYRPSSTDNPTEFLLNTTHVTKRRVRYGEMESTTCEYNDVESPRRSSGEARLASSHIVGRSGRSSSTLSAEEEEEEEDSTYREVGSDEEEDMHADAAERDSDSGSECGEESEEEGSETSSHTLGRSEGSSHTLGRSEDGDYKLDGGDDDEDMEDEHEDENQGEFESDDEDDLFAQSYREGSGK